MQTFEVRLKIRAECEADAIELLEEYTGSETDVEIVSCKEMGDEDEL